MNMQAINFLLLFIKNPNQVGTSSTPISGFTRVTNEITQEIRVINETTPDERLTNEL